jgi:hypothetical protein
MHHLSGSATRRHLQQNHLFQSTCRVHGLLSPILGRRIRQRRWFILAVQSGIGQVSRDGV